DNVPIHTAAFPTNWELSNARATAIVRYLIDEMHYDPRAALRDRVRRVPSLGRQLDSRGARAQPARGPRRPDRRVGRTSPTMTPTASTLPDEIRATVNRGQITLAPLPAVATRIQAILHDAERADPRVIADLVRADPAIAATILRMSNSVAYA